MSCPPPLQRPEKRHSSDYGSDFTPDEEELLNELLTKADADAAAPSTPNRISTPSAALLPIEDPISARAAETPDLASLHPTALAALVADIEDGVDDPVGIRLPKVLGREHPRSPWRCSSQQPHWSPGLGWGGMAGRTVQSADNRDRSVVEHPSSTEGRERERERTVAREREWTQQDPAAAALDSRSPVERFRQPPNKAFSVTDLVSPAWCELQYWYTLTKHGRKRRTPAMTKGSVVHKTLEDEIYTTVPVEITTKEDAWALRIWNVIQGLRLLREYGVTRELEVWGVVDGELVNGIIDQLSYECPDPELEATAGQYYADAAASRLTLPEYQMSLSDFLLSSGQGGRKLSDIGQPAPEEEDLPGDDESATFYGLPRVYMTDVKTKANRTVPTVKSTSFRPTLLQLQLYYHMLNRLITSDDVTMELLASRYDLDPTRSFTDAFISEVGELNDEFFDTLASQEFDLDNIPTPDDARRASSGPAAASSPPPSASQDTASILLTHSNLTHLWSFMKEQLRLTFLPHLTSPNSTQAQSVAPSIPSHSQPAMLEPYPTLLSPVLTARYLSSAPTVDFHPQLLGSRSFLFDPATMTSYLTDQMDWWRGERDPHGVEVMDAWKCRVCEFRDECSWRQERELEMARRNRGRSAGASADVSTV
ncbi:hypothetical protein NUU61_006329 [Penicillium alfredii]|uniref:Uncharacterized protein n=1 Tax=Penicillium alfredii TaxID=1506179 RepID=A0A9W9F0N2_9EURO|nr:uncharacterized protein NUU61_006329 [Penicillium alfredii]KAJ5091459.1 hypothetical protein NUU61_006329 [Penicillium alfredii]